MRPTRRVLLLTEETGVGGVQTTLSLLTSALAARGWQVARLSVRQGRPSLWACWRAARQAQVLLASNNFWPAYWAVALGWLSARPSVVWVHGPLSEVLQQAGAPPGKTRWLQTVYRLASQVVCASQTSEASFRRVMGPVCDGRDGRDAPDGLGWGQAMCVIRNPAVMPGTVSVSDSSVTSGSPGNAAHDTACQPIPQGVAPQDVIPLGFVGRLSPEKQPLQLIAMLQQLPARYQLHVVGDGELMGEMQSAGQALIAQGRLHLHGQQTVSVQTYRAWRATVLCSLYEGYPMTALESLACGVPCVSTPIPAMQEMLGPHAPGWLAQDASAQALADAVQAALAQAPEALQTALQATVAAHGFNHFSQAWDQLLSRFAPCERGPGADPHHADHNAKEPEVKP
ncbi:glycosyltransferase [Limnohabitans sp. 2KL-1]|uniref:glycosyltransferase n=1 Tax=Limnohabitans sp. 2KL-1 TaxID=1100699 RepID=UPI001304841D|nr:glycosyltransferase [Limnohabitans sp. 2KL-1]